MYNIPLNYLIWSTNKNCFYELKRTWASIELMNIKLKFHDYVTFIYIYIYIFIKSIPRLIIPRNFKRVLVSS